MYHVIGNSPKKVELKDLNDCVYYKQQKVFSDSQFEGSVDLKRAVERKTLIVLKKSEDRTGSFDVDTAIISSDIKTQDSSPKIDILLDKVNKLEDKIKNQPSLRESGDESALSAILSRLEKLETNPSSVDLTSIQEALKSIESRMQDNKSDTIIEKLESILSRPISGSGTTSVPSKLSTLSDEVYVPNIKVEDATSHINLEVRKIDSGDSVSDSLKKLKELRSKSK